jgi:outer membrane cobalamin receptor
MYRITYEQGNGYHCGCCRRTSTETCDCDTIEEVQEWIDELAASRIVKFYEYSDADDRSIESIEKEIGVDIQNEFSANKENVDKIVAERRKYHEDEKNKKEEEQRKREYEHFLKLKQQFEKE